MANLFEHKDRRVVPNWRSFEKTTLLGELNSFQSRISEQEYQTTIDDYIVDWEFNKTIIHGADLLSAAIVNNKKDNIQVNHAAEFILSNKENASKSQISLASQIIGKKEEKDLNLKFFDVSLDSIPSFVNPELIRKKIVTLKKLIINFPYNPILYVELSRFYSMLGQEEQSIHEMKIALHLAPNNRFVLRSATRLFLHFDNCNNEFLDYIHTILRKSPLTAIDPWLMSAEISIATIRERSSRFIKKGVEIINSRNISPFNFTELAGSIGTLEFLSGSIRKSRELFNKALLSPNDNSLAQIKWALNKDRQLMLNPSDIDVKMNFEALAIDSLHSNQYTMALDNAAKWFIDMPYSKRPILFASNLASTVLKEHDKAILFLNAGLISHPNDPQILNNLAYSLALENKSDEAFDCLNKIRNESSLDDITEVCVKATRGLAFFRSGFPDIGRQLYLEAIEQTRIIKDQELNWIAILNLAREELLINSEFVGQVMEAVSKIPVNSKEIDVRYLRDDVIQLFEKSKKV